MDGPRFDNLTRSLASGTSRRGIVRGFLGAAAAALVGAGNVTRGNAQEAGQAPGSTCTDAGQCSQVGGTVFCADNGYSDDGGLNCCRGAGGACADATFSADCCSGLYCRNGACTDLSATGDLPIGSFCTETTQCSQASGALTCASAGVDPNGARSCCRESGGTCVDDGACCGATLCTDGVCGGTEVGDLTAGTICTGNTECSQAVGPTICGDNGSVDDESSRCCRLETAPCAQSLECCAGMICGDNGIALDGGLNCCAPMGGTCQTDGGCCGQGLCVEGICQLLVA